MYGQEHDALLLSLHTARQERRVRVFWLHGMVQGQNEYDGLEFMKFTFQLNLNLIPAECQI